MTYDEFIASVRHERIEAEHRRLEWQSAEYRAAWWAVKVVELNRAANWQDVKLEDRPNGYK